MNQDGRILVGARRLLLTADELRDAEQAAETVDECLAMLGHSTRAELRFSNESLSNARVTAWKDAIDRDASGVLKRLIATEGWDTVSVIKAVRTLPPSITVPGWSIGINGLVSSVSSSGTRHANEFGRQPIAFEDLLFPVVRTAYFSLECNVELGDRRMLTALAPVCDALLRRLAAFAAPALFEDFVAFRDEHEVEVGHPKKGIYKAFVIHMREGEFEKFLIRRPVLARMLLTLVGNWRAAVNEFMVRLARDHAVLSRVTRSNHCGVSDLAKVSAGLSDPHNSGRSVLQASFKSGAEVLYKPRSLALESLWDRLIQWLVIQGGTMIAEQLTTVDMGDYGWQAFCNRNMCSHDGANRFYRRIGAALAVFRVLGSTDMHHENLIACADFPVFVDLETLLASPLRVSAYPHWSLRAAEDDLTHSVLKSGVLPNAMLLPTGDVMSYGGMAESPGTSGSSWEFKDINSDNMRFVKAPRPRDSFPNLPYDASGSFRPAEFRPEIVNGYTETVELLARCWTDLWREDGPFAGLKKAKVRVIFRPTATYGALLNLLRDPRTMRSGISWSCRLQMDLEGNSDLGSLSNVEILRSERRALVKGDIPYFVTSGTSTGVVDCDGEEMPDVLDAPVTAIQNAAFPVDSAGRERDRELITCALVDSTPGVVSRSWTELDYPMGPSDPNILTAEAQRIFEILSRRAVIAGDGAAWWGRKSLLKAPSIGVLGPGLYDGVGGIAVFLAAFACALDNTAAHDLAVKSLVSMRSMLRARHSFQKRVWLDLGIAFGLGGIIYSFVTASHLLEDPSWVEDAAVAASCITPDAIRTDRDCDLLGGTAGAIIGLLRLFDSTGDRRWLSLAALCGSHLVDIHRHKKPWWTERGRPILAGMAHGIAGISFALCRLARANGNEECNSIGRAGLETCEQAYDQQENDWCSEIPDSISVSTKSFWCRWFNGALGIGLAWRDQLGHTSEDVPKNAIARATRAVLTNLMRPADTLCCGNFGNVDYLLELSSVDPSLLLTARRRAIGLIIEAQLRGAYQYDGAGDAANLGLFPGISGIGYTLLRAVAPDRLPCLLTFA